MNRKLLLLVVALICLVALIYYMVTVFIPPLSRSLAAAQGIPCLYEVIGDSNGNGKYDTGEITISVPSIEVQVDDPNGPNGGHFSVNDCFISPTDQARGVHMHFIMPLGYTATSPVDFDEHIFESAHFSDNVPQPILYVQSVITPSSSG